jgi:hypothetical protein
MKHREPKPGTSLAPLEKLFWDYNYRVSGQDLFDFVLGKKDISFLDRDQVKARVLMTVGWYRLIDIFGLVNLLSLLTDDAIKWVWVEDLKRQYTLARKSLERTLS